MTNNQTNLVQNAKEMFLKNRFFVAAMNQSTAHSPTWTNLDNKEKDKEKLNFKREMKKIVEDILKSYTKPVDSKTHMKNIVKLRDASEKINKDVHFNIGKCQKLLNLLCKYYWCAGWICEPPHPTVDKWVIQTVANKDNKLNGTKWTEINKKDEYENIINEVTAYAKNEGYDSAVVWELCNWQDSLVE